MEEPEWDRNKFRETGNSSSKAIIQIFIFLYSILLIFHLDLLLFVPYDTFSQLFTIEISSLAQANHFPLVLRIEEALIQIPSIYHYQYHHYNLINNACIITYHSKLVNIT